MFCRRGHCPKVVTEKEQYCPEHTCTLIRNYDGIISNCQCGKYASLHCKLYICLVEGCNDMVFADKYHCHRHQCWYRDAQFRYCKNVAYTGVCEEHKCKRPECIRTKLCERDWCSQHKCKRSECNSSAGFGCRYCLPHKCLFGGCSLKRTNGNYCATHAPLISFFIW